MSGFACEQMGARRLVGKTSSSWFETKKTEKNVVRPLFSLVLVLVAFCAWFEV